MAQCSIRLMKISAWGCVSLSCRVCRSACSQLKGEVWVFTFSTNGVSHYFCNYVRKVVQKLNTPLQKIKLQEPPVWNRYYTFVMKFAALVHNWTNSLQKPRALSVLCFIEILNVIGQLCCSSLWSYLLFLPVNWAEMIQFVEEHSVRTESPFVTVRREAQSLLNISGKPWLTLLFYSLVLNHLDSYMKVKQTILYYIRLQIIIHYHSKLY